MTNNKNNNKKLNNVLFFFKDNEGKIYDIMPRSFDNETLKDVMAWCKGGMFYFSDRGVFDVEQYEFYGVNSSCSAYGQAGSVILKDRS